MDPNRTVHNQPTFSVELLYCSGGPPQFSRQAMQQRVQQLLNIKAAGAPLQVALRVDFAHQQALPPENDDQAVQTYVEALQSIALDPILGQCDWFICGNEPNLLDENSQMGRGMSAAWVARVVYGYGTPTSDTTNAYQFVKTANPNVQVLLPAIGPYSDETDGVRQMPPFPAGSEFRQAWGCWERYQYDLFVSAYGNNWHDPIGDVKSALHTYGLVGSDGTANGGSDEPNRDVRESTYGAQFGTRWLQDALYLFRQAQAAVYGSQWDPWVLVSECNTWRPPDVPQSNYPPGWWPEAARYAHSLPNVMGLAAFVDQDLDGSFAELEMSSGTGRLAQWSSDHAQLLEQGW